VHVGPKFTKEDTDAVVEGVRKVYPKVAGV
jgi:hypothetical protein